MTQLKYPHGTVTGYRNVGCRCEHCRAAHRERFREDAERMRTKGLPPGDLRHGTPSAYRNWSCRCEPCRRANSDACAAWKAAHR